MNDKTPGEIVATVIVGVFYVVPALMLLYGISHLYGRHRESVAKSRAQQAKWDLVTPDYSSKEEALRACQNSIPRLLAEKRAYETRRTDGLDVLNDLVNSKNYEIQLIRTQCDHRFPGVFRNINGYFEPWGYSARSFRSDYGVHAPEIQNFRLIGDPEKEGWLIRFTF